VTEDGELRLRVRRTAGTSGDGQRAVKRSALCRCGASAPCPQSTGPGRHAANCSPERRVATRGSKANPTGRPSRAEKPHEWQRSSRPRSGRGENRRGGEKPRGRNVPGEASPGEADPVTHVAEGAPNPRRGSREPSGSPAGGEASNPERAAKPVGAVRALALEPAGRRKTSRSWKRRGGSGEPERRYAVRRGAPRGR
jgi:hypothetical protein